jgi:GNAT superfamily N-acetyltransferase
VIVELTVRKYRNEEDYWRMRYFLRELFLANERNEWSWQVARLDYWRWHVVKNCEEIPSFEDAVFIWESQFGSMNAVLNPEGPGEAFLQVHPATRSSELENEMIALAEASLAQVTEEGTHRLTVWVPEHDILRQALLQDLGYVKGPWPEYQRRRFLGATIPEPEPPSGYTLRALGGDEELPARSWASWRAFHPDEPDEDYEGWEWYRNIQSMPLYRRGLDVVAVAPQGEIAAFCTVWYDDVTRTGYFEPVGTVPEHQRKGLGKAVLYEALRRLKARGATLATVGGFSKAANALYTSVFGEEYELLERWQREW